jgi:hypothetical protein
MVGDRHRLDYPLAPALLETWAGIGIKRDSGAWVDSAEEEMCGVGESVRLMRPMRLKSLREGQDFRAK